MIVRCVKINEKREELKLHKKYIVYGLRFEETKVSFLIYDTNRWYPFFYDSKYFEIIDNFMPSSWRLSEDSRATIVAYEEMASSFDSYFFDLVDIKPSVIENFMQRKREIDKEVVQNRLKNGIELKLKAINDFQTLGKVSNFKLNFENELVKINININSKTRYEYLKNSGQSWCYMKLDDGKFEAMTSVDRLNFVLKRAIKFIETT
ncbi:hypothetical protein [Campylobacter concisus]|uniref:hypothetical protein n=1 Tax=Campylobacter concisus TaxID=199 RepID=UPI000CD94978|nr:hypothetical protein [Campylobacter concisus]